MFRATFLGHQGWLFEARDTHVLVDPLLTDGFCDSGRVGRVFPPRRFDWSRWPSIDAVIFSHEHEDHFSISTLDRLDRGIPIWLSARSSVAARTILDEMGFTVHRLVPGHPVTVGSLVLHPFSADHVMTDNSDEWDVLPYLICDRDGHGNLFSHIDVEPDPKVVQAMRAVVARPGLWCCTNNAGNWTFQQAGPAVRPGGPLDGALVAKAILSQYTALCAQWGTPTGVVWSGGGMSFDGDRAWLNRNVFTADTASACASLAAAGPGGLHLAPTPGQTIVMIDGRIAEVTDDAPALGTAPRSDWPSRDFAGDIPVLRSYEPACGRTDFDERDLEALSTELDGWAGAFYGSPTFRSLYSCDHTGLEGRRPTFALVLLADANRAAYVYEYDPTACRFEPVDSARPVDDYLAGFECWATDLLAVCRGELAPSAIIFGRGRVWSAMPDRCPMSFRELCQYFHPLRRPEQFLALYRSMWRDSAASGPLVRARPHLRQDSHEARTLALRG